MSSLNTESKNTNLKTSESIKFGLIAGLLLAGFLSVLSISGDFGNSPLKFLKYIILIVTFALFYLYNKPGQIGKSYIFWHVRKAVIMSGLAAASAIIVNILLYLIDPSFSFNKFNLNATEGSSFILINFTILIEVFVLGLISAFVIFPFFKPKDDAHLARSQSDSRN